MIVLLFYIKIELESLLSVMEESVLFVKSLTMYVSFSLAIYDFKISGIIWVVISTNDEFS